MNLFNHDISFFSIYSLLLCLFLNYCQVHSMSSNINSQARFVQIYESLAINQHQIDKLSKTVQFRQKINLLSNNNSTNKLFVHQYQQLYKKLPVFTLQHLKQWSESIQFSKSCQVRIGKDKTVPIIKMNYNFISSQGEYFIFINNHQANSLLIYAFNCTLLTQISNLTVKFYFTQQSTTIKGGYQSNRDENYQLQSVFAISGKNELIQIDIQLVKKTNAQAKQSRQNDMSLPSKLNFYRILNNKIITPGSNQQIVGVVSKTLTSPKPKTKQQRSTNTQKLLLIALDSSQINIYDESGTLKLTMKEPSQIDDLYEELNGERLSRRKGAEKSLQLVNHHPHPILLQNNWVYLIDINKYTRQHWNCPYIPNIKKIFVENIHSSDIYVLTESHIIKLNMKAKDVREARRGQCEVQSEIVYFDPDSSQKKPEELTFSVHKNLIFLNNLVYNMSANSYLAISIPQITGKLKNQEKITCESSSLLYVPFASHTQMKKTQTQKTYTIALLSKSSSQHYLQLYSITQIKPQSSVLIYVIFAFLFVIFFAVKFFKSSGTNYERELLYSMDVNAEDKQVRRQQYDQLCKYMDQASNIQKQDNGKKSQNHPNQKTLSKINESKSKKKQ